MQENNVTLLRVEHLCQYFGQNRAVDDDSFEKTEGGYRKILPGLPQGELVFSLATEPTVTRPASFFGCQLNLSPAGHALLGLFALAPVLILRRRA